MFRNFAFTLFLFAALVCAQTQRSPRPPADPDGLDSALRGANQTMKQLVRGTDYAATSMMPQATLAAEHVLRSGGNAFDAAVAGQAVLGVVQPNMNGLGSDAVLLVYDAKAKKVWSINAEGTAPKLATIDWYKKNKDGKIPTNDTLLSGTVPGVVDAWYLLLSRRGTKTSANCSPRPSRWPKGMPVTRAFNSPALMKWPSSAAVYRPPDGTRWNDNEVFKNPDLARTFRRLVEAENLPRPPDAKPASRPPATFFYKGDISREMAKFSEENGGLFRYDDFASYTAKVEEPVSTTYRGYTVYKNASASQGPAELFALNILEGFDLKKMGHNSADFIHTSVEALKLAMADRDTYLGDMDFIQIPYQGLLSKEYAAARRKLIDPAKARSISAPAMSPRTCQAGPPIPVLATSTCAASPGRPAATWGPRSATCSASSPPRSSAVTWPSAVRTARCRGRCRP